jgi:basic membrane protein A
MVTTMTNLPGINPEKIIGAVGGDDDIVIRSFVYGYEQGAKYVDPEVQVKVIYVGTWDDPAKGKQAALQLYAEGADVVFQIAALTGFGVLQAAKEVGKYAIGVDSNQNPLVPGHVITSDLKEVGKSIYTIFKMILDGTFERGKVYSFGVKEGMVGLAIDEYTRKILPEDVVQKIIDIQKKVASGEIKVEPYRP